MVCNLANCLALTDCTHLQHKLLFTDLVYFFNTYHRIWSFSSEFFTETTEYIHLNLCLLSHTARVCQFHTNTAPSCTFFLPAWLISIVLSHYSKWIKAENRYISVSISSQSRFHYTPNKKAFCWIDSTPTLQMDVNYQSLYLSNEFRSYSNKK